MPSPSTLCPAEAARLAILGSTCVTARTLTGRSEEYAGLCNPDSGYILLETISQLHFDRERQPDSNGTLRARTSPDVPGWFYTSTADQVNYYFLAILSTATELKPLYTEYLEIVRGRRSTEDLEARLLRSLRIDRDLLITYQLDKGPHMVPNRPREAFAG